VTVDEFRTLNRCLDNAIADAVTAFGSAHMEQISRESERVMGEQLGSLVHELRNLLNSAMLAVGVIKAGRVGIAGATGAVLDRSLLGLRNVIDRSLAEVRLTVALPVPSERINLAGLIGEVQVSLALEASCRGCGFTVAPVDSALAVIADRQMIASALANLLQNAFKFTRLHGHVSLKAYAAADRIMIDIEDECGGLPAGAAESMFEPFVQRGADRSGLGLGLSIARRSVEACGGTLHVRDRPGAGCTFTIELQAAKDASEARAVQG
jgi:signal transduction histidine kinase